jgi:glycosyltransferase involved in cell wall biosynthesis
MKIAILEFFHTETPYSPGAPKRLQELINGMHKKNWDVISVNVYNPYVRRLFPPFISSLIEIILSFFMLVEMKFFPNAIIFFSPLNGVAALMYRIFVRGTKIIYCDRGDPIRGLLLSAYNKNIKGKFMRFLKIIFTLLILKVVFLKSDKIVFNSEARFKDAEILLRKRLIRYEIIPNNANPSWVQKWLLEIRTNPSVVKTVRSSWKGKKVIGFVGNLFIFGNGLDVLLKAFKIVQEELPEAVLIIVGDGPDREFLKQVVSKMRLNDKVHFTGGVQNPLIYVINFDLFVHPARQHSFPNAILESLMCGIPVIGSRVGGIPEILEDDDLLFNPNDINELATKILQFFSNGSYREKLEELVFNLRKKYTFDWQETMCLSIYKTINPDMSTKFLNK